MTPADLAFALAEQLVIPLTFSLCLILAGEALEWSLRAKLACAGAAFAVAIAGALACVYLAIPTVYVTLPVALAASACFCARSGLGWGRSAFLLATGAFMCALLSYASILVDAAVLREEASTLRLGLPGTLAEIALWALVLAGSAARPVRGAVEGMLLSPAATPGFWRLAWLPAAVASAAFVLFVPQDMGTLLVNRLLPLSGILLAGIAAFMALVYALFWRVIDGAAREAAAAAELQRLSVQTLQVSHLHERMEEARRARHDERQHYQALLARAEAGDLEGVRRYLTQWGASRPSSTAISYCAEPTVNAILVYWCDRAAQTGASVDVEAALPESLAQAGLSDADVSVTFGNLLENAVEALEAQVEGTRSLKVRAQMSVGGPLFLTVDNSRGGASPQMKTGGLLSTKHAGPGIGTDSVRQVATRLGGTARFDWDEHGFSASVMLPRG